MKPISHLLLAGALFAAAFAQTAVAQQRISRADEPLAIAAPQMSAINDSLKPQMRRVQLTGQLTTKGNSDFRQMRDLSPLLEVADLSQAQSDEVPDNAFHSRRNLREVRLPKGIRRIGSQAFFGCRNLERIVIPASVEEIGVAAFNGCTALTEIVLEGQLPARIGQMAFRGVPSPVVAHLRDEAVQRVEGSDHLVPLPAQQQMLVGKPLNVSQIGRIIAPPALHNEAAHARRILRERSGIEVLRGSRELRLQLDSTVAHPEGYRLEVGKRGITIAGRTDRGVFYGLMTLSQLLIAQPQQLAQQRIVDQPRVALRELMVDPVRTFIPLEELRNIVVEMARYKLNALHLHLTDDQAWRIQIEAYPKLTAMSSLRPAMDDMQYASPGFYTQQEMRDFVAFAAQYHVMVIPEIEMPGHAVAALHAYPELRSDGKQVPIRTTCGVSNQLLNPAMESTYRFLFTVFDELAKVFPAPYIHLGGDEAGQPPLGEWTNDSLCIALMDQLGITSRDGSENWRLQKHLFDRVIDYLKTRHNKTPMFWYETDFKTIQPGCVTFSWRHGLTAKAIETAMANGAKIMLSPGEHCYFDYPMVAGDMPEVNWGMPTISLEQAYQLDPAWGKGEAFERDYLFGVTGTLWSECMPTPERIAYQAYPRAMALAEVGWTPAARRNYADFVRRLRLIQSDQLRRGIASSLRY